MAISAIHRGVCDMLQREPQENVHRLVCRKRVDGTCIVTSEHMANREGAIRMLVEQRRLLSSDNLLSRFSSKLCDEFYHQCPAALMAKQLDTISKERTSILRIPVSKRSTEQNEQMTDLNSQKKILNQQQNPLARNATKGSKAENTVATSSPTEWLISKACRSLNMPHEMTRE